MRGEGFGKNIADASYESRFIPEGSLRKASKWTWDNILSKVGEPYVHQGRLAVPQPHKRIVNTPLGSFTIKDPTPTNPFSKRGIAWWQLEDKVDNALKHMTALSTSATNKKIQDAVNTWNTYTRGVSTNWPEVKQQLLKKEGPIRGQEIWDNMEETFKKAGIDYVNNPEAAAIYMSTHIPGKTGYGRMGLSSDFLEDYGGLYTSNSRGTAEGYTYGDGYIVDVKKPVTEFTPQNRQQWIKENTPKFWGADLQETIGPSAVKSRMNDSFNMLEKHDWELKRFYGAENLNVIKDWQKDTYKQLKEYIDKEIDLLVENPVVQEQLSKGGIVFDFMRPDNLKANNQLDDVKYYINKAIEGDIALADHLTQNIKASVFNIYDNARKLGNVELEKLKNSGKIKGSVPDEYVIGKVKHEGYGDENYAHYIFTGRPGDKILDAVGTQRINTGDIDKSRAHEGIYTPGFSSLAPYGYLNYKYGGRLGSGDMLERFEYGGTLDTVPPAPAPIDNTGVSTPIPQYTPEETEAALLAQETREKEALFSDIIMQGLEDTTKTVADLMAAATLDDEDSFLRAISKSKGVDLPSWVEDYYSDTFRLSDPRTIRATTGEAINPNIDLLSGVYNTEVVEEIIKRANTLGVDPYTALAIGLQESLWGKRDSNLGHVQGAVAHETGFDIDADPYGYIQVLKDKLAQAKRAGVSDEELMLQYYNGLGMIFPETEQDYHGFQMKKIYGVPVPTEGLSLRENPLYGRQIIDVRDNILKENEYIRQLIESLANSGILETNR
jgi:hypothetical protein